MTGLSTYARDTMLKQAAQLSAQSFPTTLYLCLLSSAATASQTGATIPELTSTGSYGRAACALGAPSSGTSSNSGAVTFPVSTAAYSATATNWALCDSPTIGAGNLWYFGALQGTNDVQTVSTTAQLTGGTYTLNPNGVTTAAIPYNATAAQILEFLEEAGGIGNFTATFSGNRFDQATPGSLVITFIGALASATQTLMTLTPTSITGGTLSIAHTTSGATGNVTVSAANFAVQFAASSIPVSLS